MPLANCRWLVQLRLDWLGVVFPGNGAPAEGVPGATHPGHHLGSAPGRHHAGWCRQDDSSARTLSALAHELESTVHRLLWTQTSFQELRGTQREAGAHERFSVPRGGDCTQDVIRDAAGPHQGAIPNPARQLPRQAACRSGARHTPTRVHRNCPHRVVVLLVLVLFDCVEESLVLLEPLHRSGRHQGPVVDERLADLGCKVVCPVTHQKHVVRLFHDTPCERDGVPDSPDGPHGSSLHLGSLHDEGVHLHFAGQGQGGPIACITG
uniref:Putative secreted protein n=1 Tax=Ixodes ricinus TaxID=34613 RepID=A0A6B0V501_IXORI